MGHTVMVRKDSFVPEALKSKNIRVLYIRVPSTLGNYLHIFYPILIFTTVTIYVSK